MAYILMIISFSGDHGSGKSTIAKMLAEKLGWPHYYIGGIRRQMAKEKGMTLAEYNKLGETDSSTDFEVDDYQKKLGQTNDNFIIEGRTSWLLIPHSYKIYLSTDEQVAAKRIFSELQKSNNRNEDKDLNSIDDVLASIKNRLASDKIRYKKYYNVNVYDINHYDLVVDTTNLSIKSVFERIYKEVNHKLNLG